MELNNNINNIINNNNNNNNDYYLNSFIDYIIKYFIDDSIIINVNDTNLIKIKKNVLKYKSIIAILLLIILFYIGYSCNLFNNLNNINDQKNNINDQIGGATGILAGALGQAKLAASSLASGGVSQATSDKWTAQGKAQLSKVANAGKAIKNKAGSIAKASVSSDTYARLANKFADNSDIIYRVLYSIAIFIILCIIIVPTLAFLIIGVVCYFLLKDRMKGIKGL